MDNKFGVRFRNLLHKIIRAVLFLPKKIIPRPSQKALSQLNLVISRKHGRHGMQLMKGIK